MALFPGQLSLQRVIDLVVKEQPVDCSMKRRRDCLQLGGKCSPCPDPTDVTIQPWAPSTFRNKTVPKTPSLSLTDEVGFSPHFVHGETEAQGGRVIPLLCQVPGAGK